MRIVITFIISLFFLSVSAQKKSAVISGYVMDQNENPIRGVSVSLLTKAKGKITNDSGYFKIQVPANSSISLVFSATGYRTKEKQFLLNPDEEEHVTIILETDTKTLDSIIVTSKKDDDGRGSGAIKIDKNTAYTLPVPNAGIEFVVKDLAGDVGNELTSQYRVRGGNYDENLIYINDFEIFRPYLVRSGQQEGLSFINPELADGVNFYNGGFQAKYGDKMSSVLDIQYKKPKTVSGSVYLSLLEQGIHVEGSAKKEKITYLIGIRNRNNSNLLSSQEVTGAYTPASTDIQAYVTYKLNRKWALEILGNFSVTKFSLIPETAQKTTSVFSPLFSANLGLDIYFEGQERDGYNTNFFGLSAVNTPNSKLKLKWMLSRFKNKEKENFDIAGAYLFGERDFDNSSSTFGQIINPLGAGYYQNYGRNELNIEVWNGTMKGTLDKGKHIILFGNSIEQTKIKDRLYEWEYQDSAGYSLPVYTNQLYSFLHSKTDLSIQKISGYVQDNIDLSKTKTDITVQAGVRYNYNTQTKEFLVSPRVQFSYKSKKDIVWRAAAGIYDQPPFYREMRAYDGTVNPNIKSQKSYQLVAGMEYNFLSKASLPFRVTTEAYYKNMWDVIPYDIDNVRIRYYGTNNAKAYAMGLETRLFGQLVKDAESWLSLNLMQTKENIDGDYYYDYTNKNGEIINSGTEDQEVTDSIMQNIGWLRRPTDRRFTIALFLQDYLSTNKNFKVHVHMIYGTNLPYNIPNNPKYRNALTIEPYIRVDMGFSALLLSEKSKRRAHSPFKDFENIWASFEVFNLIDRDNIISYQLIKDFDNNVFSIPNRLTPRLINFKIMARF